MAKDYKEEKGELAKSYFEKGFNCSQSVFLAFLDETRLDAKMAARIASSFGGGMGRLREVCGAVSGIFLVLGSLHGYEDAEDYQGKKEQYHHIQKLAGLFQNKNGSIVCRELLGLEQKKDMATPSVRTEEYYKKRPCGELVRDAAEILATYLKENFEDNDSE